MKTKLLCLIPFLVCVAMAPTRAADQAPAPATASADNPAGDASSDLPKRTNPLIDPLTDTPYVAVHNADIVECVVFITEFKRAHPGEHALLLTGEIDSIKDYNKLTPAVAFSWNGKVYFHSCLFGDVSVPDLSPGQITDEYMSRLHSAYVKLGHFYYQKCFEKLHLPYPSDEELYKMGITDSGPHGFPNELPGDTEKIQAQRVYARLHKLGLANIWARFNVSFKDKFGNQGTYDTVRFDFGDFGYSWARTGCSYSGLARKTYLPSMLDSVVFSIDYQKANPTEKVFCFLHVVSGHAQEPGDIVSTTVFTKNGQIWFHHLVPGDIPSSLSMEDLKDSEKVIGADLEEYAPAYKDYAAMDAQLRRQPPSGLKKYLNGYQAPDLSAAGILAALQNRGVDAKIYSGPDGPAVIFVWGNKPYTYRPGFGCFAGKPVPLTASN